MTEVVKLAKDAAEGATGLPVLGLPEGISELEPLLPKHGIVDGVIAGPVSYYLITEVTCGESLLR